MTATDGRGGAESDIRPRDPWPDIRQAAEQCRAWGEASGLVVRAGSLCCCSWHRGLVMRRP